MPTDPLPGWRETPAKASILDFVGAVTSPGSAEFVAPLDRIAVFDNDGTLWAEQPMYGQLAFVLDRAAELGQPTRVEELTAGGLAKAMELIALTHGGVTTEAFAEACRRWMASARHPRFDRLFSATAYQPMLELLDLLADNGFTCWIFSGGGVDFMRSWATEVYGLPPHRVIGSVGVIEYRVGEAGPELDKGTDIQIVNDGPQKVISIHQHIGQRPIFAAGNTDGDLQMLEWTGAGPLRSLQLAVHHTDGEREYAYDTDPILGSGTEKLLAAAADQDWTVVDMASDWATVFPPDP